VLIRACKSVSSQKFRPTWVRIRW